MKRIFLLFLFLSLVTSCKDDKVTPPEGFEHVSSIGPSHFVYISEKKYIGSKLRQKEAGRKYCNKIYQQKDYCEVYYFANKSEVPKKFPIVNRIYPIGLFEIKEGQQKFKVLTEDSNVYKDNEGRIVFWKNFYKRFYKYANSNNALEKNNAMKTIKDKDENEDE